LTDSAQIMSEHPHNWLVGPPRVGATIAMTGLFQVPPMRIAIVTAASWTGGIERVIFMLANRWANAGHSVRIITFERPGDQPAFQLDERVALEQLNLLRPSTAYREAISGNLRRVFVLRRSLRNFAPDVTLAQGTVPSILAMLAAIGRRWPTIVTERVHPAYHRLPRPWERLRRITYPWADAIVVQTRDIAKWVADAWRLPSQVMPNPIELSRFAATPPDAGREQRSRRRLIAVGRLAPQKGYDLLINAFARIAKFDAAWELVIYGDGPERAALERMIDALGLSGQIVLAGNTTAIEQAYANADLFVHAARYEGYPNVVQEALAAGKAVIATDCPGATRELLAGGRYGVLVPNEDVDALERALRALMTDDDRRAALARSTRVAVLPFDANGIADRWLELFGWVVDRRQRRLWPQLLR
jgi:GalNAc-alpha-(1->4)-GalNAc-alpha-(1->3)-diNAcBac-PP-undecaprenol alpha-1,4-N-acetyl-D-galactosaminyltransferase